MNAVVFAGPTIPGDEIRAIVDAVCLPPVAHGDVYRVSLERPRAIGIIDGYFERQPAVWHKEILWALNEGIHVFGSASMGALRAAELAPFGMMGVGTIFEAYRDGLLEDDDEVAVVHGTEDTGYRVASDAMVNIRATVEKARSSGVLDAESAAAMVRSARGLYYAERTYVRVLEVAHTEGVQASTLERFRQWLPAGAVNQKRDDAVAMLRAMRACLDGEVESRPADFVFEDSLWWRELRIAAAEIGVRDDDGRVLEALSHDPVLRERCVAAALGWQLAIEEFGREGSAVDAGHLVDRASSLCSRLELPDTEAVDRWLAENRTSRAGLEHLLETSAIAARASALRGDILIPTLLQFLRWSGDYAQLLDRRDALKPPRA
jgi:hypothetical protein